jgi:hypothetical protein
MGLEAATYISQLVATNPVGATDPRSQGDDHLRLLKSTLQNTFPVITGAVTATHTELNQLHGGLITSVADGGAGAPAYSFASDPDSGFFRITANNVRMAAGGLPIFGYVNSAGVAINQPFGTIQAVSDGTAGAPVYSFGNDPDCGMYRIGPNNLGVSVNGAKIFEFAGAGTGEARFTDGTIALPSITFINDIDTGIIRNSSNIMSLVVGGAQRFQMSATYVYAVTAPFWVEDGTSGAPSLSFVNDSDSGIWRPGGNQIQVVVGGTTCAQFYLNGIIPQTLFADGAPGAPSMSFNNDLDTGVYRSAADTYDIVCGGVSIATFDNVTAAVGQIRFRRQLYLDVNSAGSATAGAATALPANPVGYIAVTINGTQRRIPYYGN